MKKHDELKGMADKTRNDSTLGPCQKAVLLWATWERLHALEGDWRSNLFHGIGERTLEAYRGVHGTVETKQQALSWASHFQTLCNQEKAKQAPTAAAPVSPR